jgi:hypothetical protein
MTPHDTDEIGARIRAVADGVSAPMHLRAEISRERARPPRGPSRLRLALVGGLLAVAATIAGIVAPDPPSVEKVAVAALAAPTDPAPAGSDYLPGFEAIGARSDEVGGRHAETVVYRRGDTGINYTVVDGKPLDLPGTERTTAGDLELALAHEGDVNLVVWHRSGKTCILASRGASPEEMADLLRPA